MKIPIFVSLIVLIMAVAIGAFVYEKILWLPPDQKPDEKSFIEEESIVKQAEDVLTETVADKGSFEITLPVGWMEIQGQDMGDILIMAVDAQEEITNEKANEVGFATNFLLKSDDMKQYETIRSVEDYAKSVKDSLFPVIPGIEFIKEQAGLINGNEAFFIESQSRQDEIDFKTLLVFVLGKDNIIWALSFNTLADSWPTYQELFYQMANSLKLKDVSKL